MVTDILKDDLGYKGLIITDALNMGAVSNYYKTGDACVKALNAGCDMLLLTGKLNDGYTAVLDAVKSGKVSQERLDEAVLKILELKYSKLK